jgi:hypothetical protein
MEPNPSDGIIPAAQREGLTDQPPPRPALVTPDPDAAPRVTAGSGRLLPWAILWIAGLAVAHAMFLVPLAFAVGYAAAASPGGALLAECVTCALFFPVMLLGVFGVGGGFGDIWWAFPLNSLLWAATVYGLFLASRWTYRQLRQPGRPAGSAP